MEPFKELLNQKATARIVRALTRADPRRDFSSLLKDLEPELRKRELKERVTYLAEQLRAVLPASPAESFPILVRALKQAESDEVGLSGFEVWPLTHFVSLHGLDHFDESMTALEAMTQVFTSEFAVRKFFVHHETKTLERFSQWSRHPNEHVRRLVSEGSRPLLPWGEKLHRFVEKPELTWSLLEALKNDPAEYVRRSVANHLNDHSKNHADWVVRKLRAWKKASDDSWESAWIIRHGCRTLVKQGHVGALELQGVTAKGIEVTRYRILTPKIKLGEELRVEVRVRNTTLRIVKVIVDHELSLLKARGQLSPKVFKGAAFSLAGGESRTVELRLRLREVTTRTYYPGRQAWAPRVNGICLKNRHFELI